MQLLLMMCSCSGSLASEAPKVRLVDPPTERSAATARHRVALVTDPLAPPVADSDAEIVLSALQLSKGILYWGDAQEFRGVSGKLIAGMHASRW